MDMASDSSSRSTDLCQLTGHGALIAEGMGLAQPLFSGCLVGPAASGPLQAPHSASSPLTSEGPLLAGRIAVMFMELGHADRQAQLIASTLNAHSAFNPM